MSEEKETKKEKAQFCAVCLAWRLREGDGEAREAVTAVRGTSLCQSDAELALGPGDDHADLRQEFARQLMRVGADVWAL